MVLLARSRRLVRADVFGGAPDPYAALKAGLAGYWKLGETTGQPRLDSSPAANNLTNNNSCAQVAGKVGNATSFVSASSQYLSKSGFTALNGLSAFSMAGWAQRASANFVFVVAQATDANNRIGFTLDNGSNAIFNVSNTALTFGTAAAAGTGWFHLALVFDGSKAGNALRLLGYINGVAQTLSFTGTIPAMVPTFASPLEVGRQNTGAPVYSDGNIDAISVWTRVLTAAEITTLYNAGAGVEIY